MESAGAHNEMQCLTDGGAGTEVGYMDVVETVREFGAASLELIAWEFALPVRAISGPWAEAVDGRMIQSVGRCPQTGEKLFTLAA